MPFGPVFDVANQAIDIGLRMRHGVEPFADAAQHEPMLVTMPAEIETGLSCQPFLGCTVVEQDLENLLGLI